MTEKRNYVSDLGQLVERPWGNYKTIEEGNGFKVKRIEVKPNASLSLQLHHHRSEHWVVVQGEGNVTNGDQIVPLKANGYIYIPCENKHRLQNTGTETLVLVEVQFGDYLGEDDIVRFQDDYGRV